VDIFLSHDWPQGIAHHGNKQELFRRKKFLQSEARNSFERKKRKKKKKRG